MSKYQTIFQRIKNKILFVSSLSMILVCIMPIKNTAFAATDCSVQTEITQTECAALIALYNSTDGANWTDSVTNNWNQDNAPCSWTGITCNGGNVTRLDVQSNNVNGSLPIELNDLTSLEYFSMHNNQLSGAIPDISNLTNLNYFNVDTNQLSGSIPTSIGNFTNLNYLYLQNNQFDGNIPSELGNLTNLWHMNLDNNQLTGSIPAELKNLNNIDILSLSNNQLDSIPSDFGNLNSSNGITLILSGNQFSGEIPSLFGNMTNLEHLFLDNNNFDSVASGLASSLNTLSVLDASFNSLNPSDSTVINWLDTNDPDWADTQTIPPTNLSASNITDTSVQINWTPITYTADGGYYQVKYATTSGGPYTNVTTTTADKSTSSFVVDSLTADTQYYFVVETFTPAHSGQQNDLTSELSNEITATTLATPPSFDCSVQSEIPQIECEALIALYNNTDGVNWTDNTGWTQDNSPCSWYKVTCSGNHVVTINLGQNNLNGTIPSELGDLSNLNFLNFYQNELTGNIPIEISTLTNLNYLDFSLNNLTGSIPVELGNLTNLTNLNLGSNQLTGTIPPELGNLNNLDALSLMGNQLTGTIPPELGNLNNLTRLWLYMNQLTGTIPSELGNLDNLVVLHLQLNQLTGTIPPELGSLLNLTSLDLSINKLSGEIPFELGNLIKLNTLVLDDNQLSGEVPQPLVNLNLLYNFDMDNNMLKASDPSVASWIQNNDDRDFFNTQTVAPTDLTTSNITDTSVQINWTPINYTADGGYYQVKYATTNGGPYTNAPTTTTDKNATNFNITGLTPETTYYFVIETFTPAHGYQQSDLTSELSEEISLTMPSSFDCSIQSEIPQIECEALIALYNNTDGVNWTNNTNWKQDNLPCSWAGVACSGGHVTSLSLRHNNLVGTIPTQIGDLSNIEHINLGINSLTRGLPLELASLSNLQNLSLDGNNFSGSILSELGNLNNLQYLDLSSNTFSGSIPANFANLSNLESLDLGDNHLTGSIPPWLGSLNNLQSLNLSINNLTGPIPTELGGLGNLFYYLSLNYNQLSGSIPTELGSLSGLEYLALEGNQLSGSIPAELGNLSNLDFLRLDINQLSGSIPTSFTNLNLTTLWLDYNMLSATDPTLLAWLSSHDSNWAESQTVPPTNLSSSTISNNSVEINWTPINYTEDGGYYQVKYSTTSGGPYTNAPTTTTDKNATNFNITGLTPGTTYYFVIETFTPAHGEQQNDLTSELSTEISATTLTTTGPIISLFENTINFETVLIGNTSQKTISIGNVGSEDLTLGTISLNGLNASEFTIANSCDSQVLPPLGSCTFNIIFSPSSIGNKNATVTIPSNDPNTPTVTVTLSGNGSTPNISLNSIPHHGGGGGGGQNHMRHGWDKQDSPITKKTNYVEKITQPIQPKISSITFQDIQNHEKESSIREFYSTGCIIGYNNGRFFRPDLNINRAEFVKVVLCAKNEPILNAIEKPFPDVDLNTWMDDYIYTAAHIDWVHGYGDGLFRPAFDVSRAEALKVILRAYGYQNNTSSPTKFNDLEDGAWYNGYIITAENIGLLDDEGHYIRPNEKASRAEIVEWLIKIQNLK